MSLKITPSTSQQDDPTPQPEKIHCYTKLVVRYPIPFSLFCFFSTILVAYLSTTVGIDLGVSWMDFNTIIVKNNWAMTNLYVSANKLPTSSTTKDTDTLNNGEAYYADICAVEKLQTRGINGNGNRYMMFRSKTRNILTQENIDSIQKAISSVIAVPGYDKFCLRSDNNWSGCLSPKSFLQIESFSDSTANSTCGCTDKPPWYVTKISKENNFCYNSENIITPSLDSLQRPLKNLCTVAKNSTGNIMCDMWSKNIREQAFPLLWNCDDLQTEFVQVTFNYGYDFDKAMCAEAVSKSTGIKGDVGYMDNMTFVQQSEDERIYPFIHSMDSQFAKIKQDIEKENMDLEVLYSGYIDVFAVLQNDLLYMFISISFVFIILLVQTESLCITLAGLFEIIMSIPLALFVWCVLFQMEGVSSLMFVGFFVIIGIGADDIFVFVDAFKQSAYEPPHISGNLETRFQWAYKRSVTAMLATSVTTCCAFGVAGLLPMWDFQNLAVFNASMVIFDFILVITWLPCAVIISHKYLTPIWEIIKQRFGCGTKKEKNDQQTQIKPRCMERCFGGIFADCILQSKWILSMVFLILLSTTVLVSIIFVQLDGEAIKFFRPDHIETRTMEYRKKFSTPNNDYRIVTAVVGPDSMNSWDIKDARPYLVLTESSIDNKNTFLNGGKINVYSSFDLAKSQEEFIDLCTNMQIEMKTMDLTYAVEEYCFMKEFKEWSLWQGYGFPVKEDQFPTLLLDWRKDSGGYMNATIMSSQKNTDEFWWYGLCTGFALDDVLKPTKVIAAWASFNLTQKRNVEYPLEEDMALQLKVENILTSVLDDIASPTMNINSAFVNSDFFLLSWLKNTLFKFALESIIIAICCATVIIVLMTANWWIALICFFTLCCILSTALNLMIIAGWKIGLNEACCLVVAAGVSVDYVLHMAHSYNHQSGSKEERTRAALREMGISVTSGFITTVSSSFALVLCDFAIFLRLGQFLTMTLTSSWFITMFLMMSVLASVGPNEGQGDIPFLVDLVKDKSHAVGNLSVIKETNENNNTVEMTYLKKDSGSDGSDGDTVDVDDTRSKQTEKESDTEET